MNCATTHAFFLMLDDQLEMVLADIVEAQQELAAGGGKESTQIKKEIRL